MYSLDMNVRGKNENCLRNYVYKFELILIRLIISYNKLTY